MGKESDAKPLKYDVEPDRTAGEKKTRPPETQDRMKLYKCVVIRVNTAPENADMPIHVHSNDKYGNRPKQFFPNTEVWLTDSEMDVLRNSAEEDYIEIPPNSGVYHTANPLLAAEQQYPGFKARWGRLGGVVVERRRYNYAVNVLDTQILPAAGLIGANVGRAILEGQDLNFSVNPKAVDKVAA